MEVIYKLAGGWEEKENMLTIKGDVKGEEVISKDIDELRWRAGIEVIPDDNRLSTNMTSYDATRVVVKIVDSLERVNSYVLFKKLACLFLL